MLTCLGQILSYLEIHGLASLEIMEFQAPLVLSVCCVHHFEATVYTLLAGI